MSVRKMSNEESNSQDDSKLPSPCVVGRLFPSTIGQEKKGESSFLEQSIKCSEIQKLYHLLPKPQLEVWCDTYT
jgi:hypothetical protein